MTPPLTREEFKTASGRKRAWRDLMLGDHGALRKVYDNTHEIVPGRMWRTYQPSPSALAKWRDRGIKTVINLRGDKPSGFYFLEEEACNALGLELVTLRAFSRDAPSKEFLHAARELFGKIEYPAVMHCKSGADRAGLMATLYLFFAEGRPLDLAMEQLRFKYGHVKQGKTGIIDHFFETYLAHARANDLALDDIDAFFAWIDSDAYDPIAMKRDFKPTWVGTALTDVILRRE